MRNTIAAVERDLTQDGFVLRYRPEEKHVDGLPGGEGVFLPCSFWLADCLHLLGAKKKRAELFQRLLEVRNDVGLLSEEYDPKAKTAARQFPAGLLARRRSSTPRRSLPRNRIRRAK